MDEHENGVQKKRAYQVEFHRTKFETDTETVVTDGWRIADGALIFYGDESEIVYNWSKVIMFQRVEDVELTREDDAFDFVEEL